VAGRPRQRGRRGFFIRVCRPSSIDRRGKLASSPRLPPPVRADVVSDVQGPERHGVKLLSSDETTRDAPFRSAGLLRAAVRRGARPAVAS
jgi:hypothetical protein